ncbi:enoyl-CoA hydratase/isomerase family protein [Niveispirillum sp. KHB5.9]|uniref:enoyl-CoA hydratase/isomerase family protein n=1 Tax=Niveispirillum sp. KHB5.9 TaxID=3400269 RepID=UPI003A8605F9
MTYETITYERKDRLAYLMFNRPDAMNTLSNQMEAEIRAALLEFDLDDEAWVLIIHAAGKHFCAGVDLSQHSSFNLNANETDRKAGAVDAMKQGHVGGAQHLRGTGGEGWMGRTANYKPVIAVVQGYALAGGAHLAAECDMIVASEDAQFGITETVRGMSGSRTWVKMNTFMATKIASEMLITGRRFPASELYRLGFINRLTPNGEQLKVAEELAALVLAVPPLAARDGVRATRKQWVNKATDLDYHMQLSRLDLTEDFAEAGRAFKEKRKPVYKAR